MRFIAAFITTWLVSLLLFSTSVFAEEKQVVLTLKEAILLSLRYNPALQSAEIQRIVDKYSLRVAFWNYELQYALTGAASYNYSVSNNTKSENDAQSLTPSASLLTPLGTKMSLTMNNPLSHASGNARFYNPALTLNLTQPLLQGFGPDVVLAPLRQAEYQELLNRLTLKNTTMATITTVISQYAALAQAQNSLVTQRISLDASIATLNQQQAYYKIGRIARTDLVQFEASVASQRLALQQQEVALDQAKILLLTTLGIEPTTPIGVTEKIGFDNDVLPTLEECIKMGLQSNISYQQSLINLKQSKISLMLAEDQQRWTLNLSATRTQGGGGGGSPNSGLNSIFNGADYNTSVNLDLSVPIDNLQLKQVLVNAKVALRQQYIALAAQKRAVINDVINAYNIVLNQKQQIIQAKTAVDLAQQSLNVANEKLKYGRVTPFEVSTLQTNLVSAQLSYINAITAYVTNLAALDQIIGNTLMRWSVKLKY